jgi:hypothetical protein
MNNSPANDTVICVPLLLDRLFVTFRVSYDLPSGGDGRVLHSHLYTLSIDIFQKE